MKTIGFPLRPAMKPLFLLGSTWPGGKLTWPWNFTTTTQVIESNKNTNTPTQKKTRKKPLALQISVFEEKSFNTDNPSWCICLENLAFELYLYIYIYMISTKLHQILLESCPNSKPLEVFPASLRCSPPGDSPQKKVIILPTQAIRC